MKHSLTTGFSFGWTSGIITTLGLMVGLHSSSGSRVAIIGGVLTIAIADALSDALGIHVSEESENRHGAREVWESTLTTFVSKFMCGAMFIIPILLFPVSTAIMVSVAWGLSLLGILSFFMARQQGRSAWKMIAEHIGIALAVVVATHYFGDWIGRRFA